MLTAASKHDGWQLGCSSTTARPQGMQWRCHSQRKQHGSTNDLPHSGLLLDSFKCPCQMATQSEPQKYIFEQDWTSLEVSSSCNKSKVSTLWDTLSNAIVVYLISTTQTCPNTFQARLIDSKRSCVAITLPRTLPWPLSSLPSPCSWLGDTWPLHQVSVRSSSHVKSLKLCIKSLYVLAI